MGHLWHTLLQVAQADPRHRHHICRVQMVSELLKSVQDFVSLLQTEHGMFGFLEVLRLRDSLQKPNSKAAQAPSSLESKPG